MSSRRFTLPSSLVINALFEARAQLAAQLNQTGAGSRDFNKEFGYITGTPTIKQYRDLFDRNGLANRVVSVYPEECWSVYPDVYETDTPDMTNFERVWQEITEEHSLWTYFHRIDELSGIGSFGIMLFGFDDGLELDKPAKPGKDGELRKILYVRCFDESLVQIGDIDRNQNSPRYGQPLFYTIKMSNVVDSHTNQPGSASVLTKDVKVHWTRILHVADNRESSEIIGVSRLQNVVDYLYDIRKVAGGSAEMYWRGALPGFAFKELPNYVGSDLDEESVKEQFEKYSNGLQRYLALSGLEVDQLTPQIADPTNALEAQIKLICCTIGVPMRIFLGAEAGHLASQQDASTWNGRVMRRHKMYLTPFLLRPFVKMMIMNGVLPPPQKQIIFEWPDLNSLTEKDQASINLQRATGLAQYTSSGAEALVPLYHYLTLFMNISPELAQRIVDEAQKVKAEDLLSKKAKEMPKDGQTLTDRMNATSSSGGLNKL